MNAASLVQRLAGISGALAVSAGAYGAHGKCPFWSIVFCLANDITALRRLNILQDLGNVTERTPVNITSKFEFFLQLFRVFVSFWTGFRHSEASDYQREVSVFGYLYSVCLSLVHLVRIILQKCYTRRLWYRSPFPPHKKKKKNHVLLNHNYDIKSRHCDRQF